MFLFNRPRCYFGNEALGELAVLVNKNWIQEPTPVRRYRGTQSGELPKGPPRRAPRSPMKVEARRRASFVVSSTTVLTTFFVKSFRGLRCLESFRLESVWPRISESNQGVFFEKESAVSKNPSCARASSACLTRLWSCCSAAARSESWRQKNMKSQDLQILPHQNLRKS